MSNFWGSLQDEIKKVQAGGDSGGEKEQAKSKIDKIKRFSGQR